MNSSGEKSLKPSGKHVNVLDNMGLYASLDLIPVETQRGNLHIRRNMELNGFEFILEYDYGI